MYKPPHAATPDPKRLMLAMFLAAILVVFWQLFVEAPKREKLAQWQQEQEVIKKAEEERIAKISTSDALKSAEIQYLTRDDALKASPRLEISSSTLHGSIALKGLKFDDATLVKYRTHLEPESPEVVLLTPAGGGNLPYLVQIGWTSEQEGMLLPDKNSLWKSDVAKLTPQTPANLEWKSPQGVLFKVKISMNENYLFAVEQSVVNSSKETISVTPYALINRGYADLNQHMFILHEGPIGVFDGILQDPDYKDLREDGAIKMEKTKGWLGFTDKYWLSAIIPSGEFSSSLSYYNKGGVDRYQADVTSAKKIIAPNETISNSQHIFIGAKELDILDAYANGVKDFGLAPTPLFDRAVDFGWFYFLTKPIFLTLNFFYSLVGNFGVAILILTFLIKLLMYPLAHKGYKSAAQLRKLQPEMLKIKDQYGQDKMKLQQELLALYKREKANPAAGCLPLLIQMPVFFALYKVLFVTIEMRQAHFFAWWQDLSAIDPTNLFTGFGLLEWTPPSFLHIGILPILMTISMIVQMKQQPKPTDPAQAKVMTLMPYFMMLIMINMPSGLLVYWIFSNVLSIIQQHFISIKLGLKKKA